jgi:hypothetical protein
MPICSPSVLALMGNAQSFNMGRIGNDMPRNIARVITNSGTVNIGADGTFPCSEMSGTGM